VSKMIMAKTGANLMGMINGLSGLGQSNQQSMNQQQTTQQTTQQTPEQSTQQYFPPKRKMGRPNININDLPEN